MRVGLHNYYFNLTNLWTSDRSLIWFATKSLTFQEFSSKRSLQKKRFTLFYHRVQTTISELTENSYWPIIENTQFVQLSIFFRHKSSAVSNSTFISFGSSVLFVSNNWLAASRVFLVLNRSDSLAFVVRWTSTFRYQNLNYLLKSFSIAYGFMDVVCFKNTRMNMLLVNRT